MRFVSRNRVRGWRESGDEVEGVEWNERPWSCGGGVGLGKKKEEQVGGEGRRRRGGMISERDTLA